ncbi:hypothetical protein BN159_1248 [Streptomyces davaonensis JCM 4913]|uniref:Uncharacterized protein n=1 Tax=Streptomyces davaonensis (strain DSM 101723 / JCM 4913 / KCC S-0913 / 768) TaxID=1214101 RepID=K4QXH2_STRDJ|nr:hypothetical protein [Streptomyces davaonensis]CCK25627.1 hypothetical protein BN159_1248 [Streptomyces davaonensis JCM 4913]
MPERNPVTDPEKVQFIWFGEEMSDNAKAGLRALSQRFPNSAKELVVMPRRPPGEAGRQHVERLLDGYRNEAQQHGVDVLHIRDHTDRLAAAVAPKYGKKTLDDIFSMEMGNQGYIAAKDLATFALRGTETGLSVDLSHHHMTDTEWDAVQQDRAFSQEAAAPVDFSTAELKVVDLSHGEDANMRHVLNASFMAMTPHHGEAGIDPQMMPHLDVFAMYTRAGTRGQEVAQAAANQYIGYLGQMSQDEVRKGNVSFRPNDDSQRFRPDSINLADDNLLGAKYNTQDPSRGDIIGRMAVSALADGVHLVYGTPTTPPGGTRQDMPMLQVDQATWKDVTMQAFQVGNVRVLPQLSLGKDNQNSWRTAPSADPSDVTGLAADRNVTLVQVSNYGVREAAALGMEGLNKPAHLPYEVRYSTSADNSPRRTPSPTGSVDVDQLRQQVAGLTMPRTPSPERPGLTGSAANPPAKPPVKRSATGPAMK